MSKLPIILLSSCLFLFALAPTRLKLKTPESGEPPGATETYDDDILYLCSEDVSPTLDNLDNYDWTYCSFGLQRIWRALNIREDLFITTRSLAEAYSAFGDLDRDGHAERILRLTLRNDTNSKVRFVVMKYIPSRVPEKWLSVAHLDIPNFHLAPEPRIVTGKRSNWLVLTNIERSWPPAPLQENEEWYELQNGRLVSVLSFPMEVDAFSKTQPPVRQQVHAESLLAEDAVADRVTVSLTVSSTSPIAPPTEIHRTISFVKDSSARFVFDPPHSDISETAYRAIGGVQSAEK
jgi:hypothetical protein